MRIAMWSGPRNLSTAMMYAFAQRADCAVWDEPFYAAYLKVTGIDHPMRDEILAAGETDPNDVAEACIGPIPQGKSLFYQKHMAQHMVAGMPLDWADRVTNVFLIRHPAYVVASYAKKREAPVEEDLGFVRLAELFDRLGGDAPIVVDSADIRRAPVAMLQKLCTRLGIDYDPAMTRWPAGGNPADGVWSPHWYGAIHASTGFSKMEGDPPELTGDYARLVEEAMPHYLRMADAAMTL
ncbi:sulfotransferase-like domain-containing protein [Acidimangrovimonas sediminis]|uniref:sulfotransferase-like domain-containing protein n=1 Tax=Acidimangrovimonas sediminis TaxID=2056283 RepID=UPI000C7FB2AC|nr:sulfotransferase family protein [Acidimangrovimonas sediminis]